LFPTGPLKVVAGYPSFLWRYGRKEAFHLLLENLLRKLTRLFPRREHRFFDQENVCGAWEVFDKIDTTKCKPFLPFEGPVKAVGGGRIS
jgi:hypothetical protein